MYVNSKSSLREGISKVLYIIRLLYLIPVSFPIHIVFNVLYHDGQIQIITTTLLLRTKENFKSQVCDS